MPRRRLVHVLARILGPATLGGLAAGCDFLDADLDDVACIAVELGEECPSVSAARRQLVGDETCEDPVREVVSVGELLYANDVVFTGYGGYDEYTTGDTASDTGAFREPATNCCYEAAYKVHRGEACIPGRPLRVGGRTVSARACDRSGWRAALVPGLDGLDGSAREALAEAWATDGLLEHASVASFARLALDLLALGAPADLLARTSEAMADEVVHAEVCFALASGFAGRPVGPGPLPVPARAQPDLVQLAVETFTEGCVGETLAAARAAAQLRAATDPAVRAVLARIVADESRHAELAWDIVRWAVATGGLEVRTAVAQCASALALEPAAPTSSVPGHGLVDSVDVDAAVALALAEVVRPETAELLAA